MRETRKSVGVLFVCTGNICRSPTAEGVFRHLVEREGIADRVLVDSAGIAAWHEGEPPDRRAQAAARRRGVDLGHLRARPVIPQDYGRFTHILAMDRGHYRDLLRDCPRDKADRVKMFLSFTPELGSRDVPDPYYGDAGDFEHVLDLVEAGAQGLLAEIRRILSE
ncbi:MAG: low molecular weight protein-tyrosine-phosphatase [Alphaproteobacteria bacterium]